MTTATQRYFHVISDAPVRPVTPQMSVPAQPWQSGERPWQSAPMQQQAAQSQPAYGYRVPTERHDYAHEARPARRRLSIRAVLSLVAGIIAVGAALAAAFVGLFGGLLSAPSIVCWLIAIVGVGAAVALATSALVRARRDGRRSTTAAVGLIFAGLAVVVSIVDLVVQLLVGMR